MSTRFEFSYMVLHFEVRFFFPLDLNIVILYFEEQVINQRYAIISIFCFGGSSDSGCSQNDYRRGNFTSEAAVIGVHHGLLPRVLSLSDYRQFIRHKMYISLDINSSF